MTNFRALGIALLTVSDSRSLERDKSGDLLSELAKSAGHNLIDRALIADDRYQLRAQISTWALAPEIEVVITTGGTGFTSRDTTPEALLPLFDKIIDGFGELFRAASFKEIGAATIQSRAIAGIVNGTLIFCLPGSTNACKTGWCMILETQLDARTKPCNFVDLMPRLKAAQNQALP